MTNEPTSPSPPDPDPVTPGGQASRDALLAAVGVASAAGSLLTLPLWTALFTLGAFAAVVALLLRDRRLVLALIAVAFFGGGLLALVLGGSSDRAGPRQATTGAAAPELALSDTERLERLEQKIDSLLSRLRIASADTQVPLPDLGPVRDAILEYVNRLRDRRGVPALRRSVVLERAAQSHVADMLDHDDFGHVASNGETLRERVGGGWRHVGEAIAYNLESGDEAWVHLVDDLQGSSTHRRVLDNAAFRYAGIGIDFGSFAGSAATVVSIVLGSRR